MITGLRHEIILSFSKSNFPLLSQLSNIMSWTEVAPGKSQRAIGKNETFKKHIGDTGHSLGRERWAVNPLTTFVP